jgi:hypothetical protein
LRKHFAVNLSLFMFIVFLFVPVPCHAETTETSFVFIKDDCDLELFPAALIITYNDLSIQKESILHS